MMPQTLASQEELQARDARIAELIEAIDFIEDMSRASEIRHAIADDILDAIHSRARQVMSPRSTPGA